MDTLKNFIEILAARKTELGLTDMQLAYKAGRGYNYLDKVLSGQVKPGAEVLFSLADALGYKFIMIEKEENKEHETNKEIPGDAGA